MAWLRRCALNVHVRWASSSSRSVVHHPEWPIISEVDLAHIERNIILREHVNNIPVIRSLLSQRETGDMNVLKSLYAELDKLPNETHPRLVNYGTEPQELMRYESKKLPDNVIEFSEICRKLNLFRMDHLSNFTGHKSYYLFGALAELEHALVQYALAALKQQQFQLVSVPDILPPSVIVGCGMKVDGERNQVYKLESGDCLSGTAEMSLAGFFANKIQDEANLPIKVMAMSRCYRAETSGLHEEKGLYRVHQFTKLEMFAICSEEQSDAMLTSFKDGQVELFKNLEFNFRLLDMPPFELGTPAYQKYDIEAWMPGRQMWGEVSSCSNCTDYQAKRLNIRYRNKNNELLYAHTVNGTAVAIPRLLISIVETHQTKDSVLLPAVLSKYMTTREVRKNKNIPDVKLVKSIKLV